MDVNDLPGFVSSVCKKLDGFLHSNTWKIITVSRIMQKSNTTGTFHYISNSVFKRNSHLCWSVEAMLSFIAYDGRRFAKKLDRYITTTVFKDGRRCKCIMRECFPRAFLHMKYF